MFSNAESAGRTEWLECVGSDDINFLNTKKILSEETQGESNKDSEADKNLQLPDLTPAENAELRKLVEKSKIPNNLNYLENSAYMKFLWQVEYEFNLPRNLLSCMCWEESRWSLYAWKQIIWSRAWAKWLFQFMPFNVDSYMINKQVLEYCWIKKFKSKDEFLKNPLATAVAAGIMISDFMGKWYNFQTALACYNWWPGSYQDKIEKKKGRKNLTAEDFSRLPRDTRAYVLSIGKGVKEGSYKKSITYEETKNAKSKGERVRSSRDLLARAIENNNNIINEVLADSWSHTRNKNWNSMV